MKLVTKVTALRIDNTYMSALIEVNFIGTLLILTLIYLKW